MKTQHNRTIRTALAPIVAATLLLSTGAEAGKATVQSANGDSAMFEYAGKLLRMNMQEAGTYMLMREGTMYIVNTEGDQPMVFNASSMMRGMAKNAAQFAPDNFSADFESLEDTGRDETVAGIRGDVYLMRYTDEDGKSQQQEVVLAKDKLAREFRDALLSMASMAEDIGGEQAREQNREFMQRLEKLNAGILRVGEDMRVTEISGEKIPAERFALPAEPMDMQGLGSMLGAAMSQQSGEGDTAQGQDEQGGLLSGMLGAFGKKPADADDEPAGEEDTEKEKKNPFKALGKLFGDPDGGN